MGEEDSHKAEPDDLVDKGLPDD